jgi:LuxR family transcriptional regulator, maltose regulon positive regulatory protein
MGIRAPTVWEDRDSGEAALDAGPRLDTSAWRTWLDDPATLSFSYPVYNAARGYIEGFMTVRKERRARGGAYWTAYWRVGGRLCKVYLGRSSAVTSSRLRAVGAAWLAQLPAAPGPDHPDHT